MTEESIMFTKDETQGCWTSVSPDGKKRAHVRKVWDDPLMLTVEMEAQIKSLDDAWVSIFYEVVDISKLRLNYPETNDKIIRKNFAQIVRQALLSKGWLDGKN